MSGRRSLALIVLLSCMTLQLLCCQRAFAALDQFARTTIGQKQQKQSSIDNVGGVRQQLHTRTPRQPGSDGNASPDQSVHFGFNTAVPVYTNADGHAALTSLPRTAYTAPIWLVHRALLL